MMAACAAMVSASGANAVPVGDAPPAMASGTGSVAPAAPGAGGEQAGGSAPQQAVLLPASVQEVPGVPGLAVGTQLHLMVLTEVTSRTAHAGDRFKLRVNEPVVADGKTVVPVGATAWGEVINLQASGAVGKSGKLGARLLYLDLPTGPVPLEGAISRKGDSNTGGVAMAVVGFGILGLLAQGDSARLHAGDVFIGTVTLPKTPEAPPTPAPAPTAAPPLAKR